MHAAVFRTKFELPTIRSYKSHVHKFVTASTHRTTEFYQFRALTRTGYNQHPIDSFRLKLKDARKDCNYVARLRQLTHLNSKLQGVS
jgi:hypothetical protein